MSSNNKNKDLVFSAVSSSTDNLTQANALYLYIYQAALLAQKKWPSDKSFKQIQRKNAQGQATSVRESWPRDRLTSLCEQITQTPNAFTITKDDIEAVVQAYKYSGVLWGEWKLFSEEKVRAQLKLLGCAELEVVSEESNADARSSATSPFTNSVARNRRIISTPQKDKATEFAKAGHVAENKAKIIHDLKALLNVIAIKNTQVNESNTNSFYCDALNAIITKENKSSLNKGRKSALKNLNAKLVALGTKVLNISDSKNSDDVNGFVEAISDFNQALSEFCEVCRKDSFRHHSHLANIMENFYINELSAKIFQGDFIAIEKADAEEKARVAAEAAKNERAEQRKIAAEKAKKAAKELAETKRLENRKTRLGTVLQNFRAKQEAEKKKALTISFSALKHNMESKKAAEETEENARLRNSSLSTLNVEDYDATNLTVREQIALEYSLANISAESISSDDSSANDSFSDDESDRGNSTVISTTPERTPKKLSPNSIALSPALKDARVVRQNLFGSSAHKVDLPEHVEAYLVEQSELKDLLLGQGVRDQESWSSLRVTVTSFILYAIEKFTVKKPDLLESVRVLLAINYLIAVLLKLRAPENSHIKKKLFNMKTDLEFLETIRFDSNNAIDKELFYELRVGTARSSSRFGGYLGQVAEHASTGFARNEVESIQKLRQETFNMLDRLGKNDLTVADKIAEYETALFSPTNQVSAVIRQKVKSRARTDSFGSSASSVVLRSSPDRNSMCMRPSVARDSMSSLEISANKMKIPTTVYSDLKELLGKNKRLIATQYRQKFMRRVTSTYSINMESYNVVPGLEFNSWDASFPHVPACLYLLLHLENKRRISFKDISDVEQGLQIINCHMNGYSCTNKHSRMTSAVKKAVKKLCPQISNSEGQIDPDDLNLYQHQLDKIIDAVKQYKLLQFEKVFNVEKEPACELSRGSDLTEKFSATARLFFEINDINGYGTLIGCFASMTHVREFFAARDLTSEQVAGFFNSIAEIVFSDKLNSDKKLEKLDEYKSKCELDRLKTAVDDFSTNLKQSCFGVGSSAHNAQKHHPSPDKYAESKVCFSDMH